MYTLYQWLHDKYLAPKLQNHVFPDYVQQDKEKLENLVKRLQDEERLDAFDLLARLQEDYSIASFTYGVQFGIMLAINAGPEWN